MIIKHRVFKVEKMSDFLAQKNAREPPSKHFFTPKKSKRELNETDDLLYPPYEFTPKKLTPNNSSNRTNKPYQYSRSPLPREPLPPIHESPNFKEFGARNKKSIFRIPSRSTPRLEPRVNISSIKVPTRKPLYNEKHIDVEILQDNKWKMIDRNQLKTFTERYKLEFVTGYHNMNIFARCVELLNSEHDPFVLENIIPNKYKEYVIEAGKGRLAPTLSYSELSSQISSKKSTQESSFASYLPDIRKSRDKDGSSVKSRDSAIINKTHWDTPNGTDNKINTISSNFSLNSRVQLPKLDLESFKNALDYFKRPEQEGIFVYIKTINKGVAGEFGFCELIWNEKKKNVACVTKFFIPRVYRKMRMVLPITLRLVEYLFKALKLDKLVIKLLAGNTFAQNDLRILGFKLEKIDFEDGKKFKLFSMKRMDLEDLLYELSSQG